jgi:hypothetical protein
VSAGAVRYLLLAWMIGGCRQAPSNAPPKGHLDVGWQGRDPGRIAGSAAAGWCALRRVLEIHTVRGDTGIALALYPGKSLAPGVYRVLDPVKAESVPPAAAIAVRWLGKSVIQGFQSDSGRIDLQRSSSGLLSGRVSARARSVVDTQRIVLTGTFRDVLVRPDSLGCQPAEPPDDDADPDDTGVH